MKPSGIEWIGDIPDDWEVRKVKRLFSYQKGKNAALLTKEYISLHPGEYPVLSGQTENDGILGYYESYEFDLDKDSIFVTTVGAKAMSTRLVNAKFSLSQNCALLHKIDEKSDVRFLHYALFPMFEWQKSMISLIMQPSLRFEDLDKATLPYPPTKTQQKIADYLDEKCGEIDATIAKQKESIEKLKAYKQSLISETVTKGLDKSAPLKPSGIDYLGDIPNDWEVIKTKFLFNVYGGSTPKVNVPEYWGDKITWITPGELGDDIKIVLNSKRMLSEKGLNSCGATLVSKGSIIISNRAPIGQVCLAGSELCTNQGCKSLVAKIKLSCLFFYYFFKVQSEVLNMLGNGTTFMELSTSDLLNFKIPCPTIKEQQKIADYLDSKCSQIDKYITEKQNIIQKLDAYKKSLIFECVTGKQIT